MIAGMAPEALKSMEKKKQPQSASRAWEALTPALSEWILEAVSAMGFERMTPVQSSTIPLFISSKDVVVEAVTGSGKTLAFLIPVVERLLRLEEPIRKHHVGAIIISPTRELATQIHSVLLSLLSFHAPSAAALASVRSQSDSPESETAATSDPSIFSSSTLKILPQLLLGGTTTPQQDLSHFLTHSPNLLISTPGRLLELLSSPHVHCPQSSFEVLVLDEADRLLDLGFKDTLQKILQRLPKQRRTGLFSASISEAVDQLVRVGLRNPVKIAVKVRGVEGQDEQRTPASLQMTYLTTTPTHRLPIVLSLLHNVTPKPQKSIAFLSTCAAVDHFSHLLNTLLITSPSVFPGSNTADTKRISNLTVIPLHGKHTPSVRQKNYTRFLTTPTPTLLLTTDVAARGLDIPAVDLTLQLDPPSDPKTFLHRAGRAGRAGRKGLSIVFLLPGRESDSYPSFLSVRKTPVIPLSTAIPNLDNEILAGIDDESAARATKTLQAAVLTDRALHDRGQRAFVSWVRSYRAHAAASIFRIGEIDWEEQAKAWGLLKIPKMPELKMNKRLMSGVDDNGDNVKEQPLKDIDTSLGLSVDWHSYAYKTQAQEQKRLNTQDIPPTSGKFTQAQRKAQAHPRSKAWSTNNTIAATAAQRRERKAAKREAVAFSKLDSTGRSQREEVAKLVAEVRKRYADDAKEGVARLEEGEFSGFGD